MTGMINLDTHILVFALSGGLRPTEILLLAKYDWSISAMVLWEMAMLAQRGRLDIDIHSPEVVKELAQIHIWPITLEIAIASTNLDFRSDPADELISATSVVHRVPLVTRDRLIGRSQIVPLATVE